MLNSIMSQRLTGPNLSAYSISLFQTRNAREIFCICYYICTHTYDFNLKSANCALNQAHSNSLLRFLIEALLQMLLMFKILYNHVVDSARFFKISRSFARNAPHTLKIQNFLQFNCVCTHL